MASGGCHCGAVRYEAEGEILHHAICHCEDCRRSAGAPMVAWIAFKSDQVRITAGTPKVHPSSEHGRRHFCGDCGTGLLYLNEAFLPGITDIQSATLDDSAAHAPGAHIQYADHLGWTEQLDSLPKFERYPG
ncbi:GFA family protein [Allosphingosinicella deserti]|uniref:Aldehyde-activating protein n=1 Tax=Allosphingosinicella deserti TaxID=2116704 RepID=A0A2P7QR83_9SPHN|nr:GFA family protein [Sphingomonas deserti]PSJ40485.1 aldehyde-activating protein [Sphingomonas deserti]